MTQRLLLAFIRHPVGDAPHLAGHEHLGGGGRATRLEIATDDGSYFLLRFNDAGEMVGETWHSALEDAKRQASLEYTHTDWRAIEDSA